MILPDDKVLAICCTPSPSPQDTSDFTSTLHEKSMLWHNNSLFFPYGLGWQAHRERDITGALLQRQFQERSNWVTAWGLDESVFNNSLERERRTGIILTASLWYKGPRNRSFYLYYTDKGLSVNCIHILAWEPRIFQIKASPKSKHRLELQTAQANKSHITRQTETRNPHIVTTHSKATCPPFVTANPAGIYQLDCSEVWRNKRSYPRT